MILFGWVTETSILACFLSTVGPGIAITIGLSVVNLIWARRFPDLKLERPLSFSELIKEFGVRTGKAGPALMLPIVILGGIYGGIFTATEAAAVAAVLAIPVGFWVYQGLHMKNFLALVVESATAVGSIMVMIAFCLMLSQVYVALRVPQALVEVVFSISKNKLILLFIINLFLFLVGMIVNDATGMLLVAPLLLPLVKELGIHPIHFASIMGVNLAMGGVTPPYASILYLGMRIGNCEFTEILPPTLVFLFTAYIPVVFLTTYWPELSLFLPRLMGYVQ